jgi:uncharacterized protein YbjT (DUF2867 family)
MDSKQHALIVGATGLIGRHCVELSLASDHYDSVTVFVRTSLSISHPKLNEIIVTFDSLERYFKYIKVNDIFCCLGSTIRKAGSKEAFRKVDFDYVLSSAQLGLQHGASQFLLVSSLGADASSSMFYTRVKGEIESALSDLNYPCLHILRPSMLLGKRQEFRLGELIGKAFFKLFSVFFVGPLRQWKGIHGRTVAKAMLQLAAYNHSGNHVHLSHDIQQLVDTDSI